MRRCLRSTAAHLEFNAPPDYETEAHSYAVEVTASDGTNATTQTLTVTLTDENDNAPVITSAATPSVAENTTAVVDAGGDRCRHGRRPERPSRSPAGRMRRCFRSPATATLEFSAPRDYETDAAQLRGRGDGLRRHQHRRRRTSR